MFGWPARLTTCGGFGGNAFYYTPSIGLFVVRPPDLGTGGGSVTGGASGSGGSGGGGSVKQ